MKKKVLSLLLAAALVLSALTGCGGSSGGGEASSDGSYKAALLIAGTLGDKSFWDSANEGLAALKDELGGAFDYKVEQMGAGASDQ